MAVTFTTTKSVKQYAKVVVYGASGVGKTALAKTCPKPLIISSEHRLLTLSDENIPVIMIENHDDLETAYQFVTTNKKAKGFQTIILDSISDIAEAILTYFKENPKDGNTHPQAAYGSMADALMPLIRKFRDIPDKHVYIIAKIKMAKDEYTGINQFAPSLPGQVLPGALPYMFDFVLPMRIGETADGKKYRYIQTQEDIQYIAKACSHNLNPIERPDLGKLFDKILKGKNTGDDNPVPKADKTEKESKEDGKDAEKTGQEPVQEKVAETEKEKTAENSADNPGEQQETSKGEAEKVQAPGDFEFAD